LPAPCDTSTYSTATIGQTPIPAVDQPVPVAVQITGLAPGTLYHYRIRATHPRAVSKGNDVLVFTQPRFRRKPTMTTRTSPSGLTRKLSRFSSASTRHCCKFFRSWLRCTGRRGIRYHNGRKQVAFVLVP